MARDERFRPREFEPFYAAKTRLPTLPRPHLPRPHLLKRLRRTDRRVALLCAGAGVGKTTVLAEFASRARTGVFWYTIDDLDVDDLAFLHGLTVAIGQPPSRPPDRLGYLAHLASALRAGSNRQVLVLDDLHLLTTDDAARSLADLIRYLPANTCLMAAGRAVPARLETIFDWLAAQGQLLRLGWSELQLASDELEPARALFGQQLAERWVLPFARHGLVDLERYLRHEVLEGLGPAQTDRLTRLSVVPSFDCALASAIVDVDGAEAASWIEQLYRETPLLECSGGGQYRFCESARHALAGMLDPAAAREARLAAARALLSSDVRRSAEYYLLAGDVVSAAKALATLPIETWAVQAPTPEHQLLDRFPDDALSACPALRFARAWASFTWRGEGERALRHLEGVDRRWPIDELAAWSTYLRSRVAFALGRREQADEAYRRFGALGDALRSQFVLRPEVGARLLCRQAILEATRGDYEAALASAARGVALIEAQPSTAPGDAGPQWDTCLLHHTWGLAAYLNGDYDTADAHIAAALELAADPAQVAERAWLLQIQAAIARCRGEFARSLRLLEVALREPLLATLTRGALSLEAGHTLADLEDFRTALRHYQAAAVLIEAADRNGWPARPLRGLVLCGLRLGLQPETRAALDRLEALPPAIARFDRLLAVGLTALATGDPGGAAAHFAEASQVVGTTAGIQDQWLARLLEVQARVAGGDWAGARARLIAGLPDESARPLPCVGLWAVRPIFDLLVEVNREIDNPSLARLIKLMGSGPVGPRLRHVVDAVGRSEERSIREVTARLFGVPALVVDGDEVEWPIGFRRKAIELLWYALAHPDGFDLDRASADLFPERSTAKPGVAVALAELRTFLGRVLGVPGDAVLALVGRETYQFRTEAFGGRFRIDTAELAALLEEMREPHPWRAAPTPDQVPGLFRGEFLAGIDAEWVLPFRRYWGTLALRALGKLAARYARAGNLQEAVHCHELALGIDPTLEGAHTALIKLYHVAGDEQAMRAQMWQYRSALRDELDTDPAPEIETLYRRLVDDLERAGETTAPASPVAGRH